MLYLCLLNPESNQRALLAGPSQGALVNEYTAYEQAALSWLQEAGFDMAYVDLDALSAETRLATLARLPFSQARDLGPEPEEFPPLVSPKTPPLQQQLLGNQTADAMVERLRQLLLRT